MYYIIVITPILPDLSYVLAINPGKDEESLSARD